MNNFLSKFLGVGFRGQTYLNMLYLLLAFPLGLAYFVLLVTGLSAGIGLVIVWVGLLILAGVIAAWYGLIVFERNMAIWMLREQIPPVQKHDLSGKTLWQKFKATMSNSVMWKGLVYLLAKFPLGMVSFIILVTLLAVSISLLGAPFYYNLINPVFDLSIDRTSLQSIWTVDTLGEALLAALGGLVFLLLSMHVFNGLAWVSGRFARVMLGNASPAAAVVVPAVALAVASAPVPVVEAPAEVFAAEPAVEIPAEASAVGPVVDAPAEDSAAV